jgi:predicted membrane protein
MKTLKKIILLALIFVLVITCGIQQYIIQEYKQSEKEWVELSKLWREKLDTCMNRNERIYNQLYEFQDIRIKQLKGELPK